MNSNLSGAALLEKARSLAQWYLANMSPRSDNNSNSGQLPFTRTVGKQEFYFGCQWNLAFSLTGMLSAAKVFQDERYLDAADVMANYLKTTQIFDPFHPLDYGAFRECTAQTGWCFVRDALSCAWGMAEYYRVTGKEEYIERAVLWAKWFLKRGMDASGWPYWGVYFDEIHPSLFQPEMHNELHGCFHGGALNFFYRLYKITGDRQWVGGFYEHIADYFCARIQQKDGFFRSIDPATGRPPEDDPQKGLHRGNDDLGSLGLLGAWEIFHKETYLAAVRKFLTAVFQKQAERSDGQFEQSCAAVPVILNTIEEGKSILHFTPPENAGDRALEALLSRQFPEESGREFAGAIDEQGDRTLCLRSMCYTLIYLLKKYGGDTRFLSIA